ncbi:hypothetical protein HMPREF1604_00025 [Escherichia coli 908519]|uniref:Uncharacterized protein n=1 Tax=Escherichia coli TaxID=562 RepID=Q3L7H6_ECOLX|nr:hypothetical protein O2ColV31 [Escherichia coli]ESD46628.1 hypothetical protein HMPREF1604_00025 [Escherichia coli 908519]
MLDCSPDLSDAGYSSLWLDSWLQLPHSQRHQVELKQTGQIKQFWLESWASMVIAISLWSCGIAGNRGEPTESSDRLNMPG